MAGFMGPGPWTIRRDLPLPGPGGTLHITNKNRGSNISVGHMLKLVFRVERGDDEALDPASGKRKLFDIVVQTPVHILSHMCNPEHTLLPAYSRLPDPGSAVSVTSEPVPGVNPPVPSSSAPLLEATPSAGSIAQRRSISGTRQTHHHASLSLSAVLPGSHHSHHPASIVSDQSASSRSSLNGEATSPGGPLSSQERQGQQHSTPELFERLVAGQETEEGEAPPSYEAAVTIELASSSGISGGTVTPPILMVEEHH
uniref:Uncharacterized protein n=1 Tax=Ganoderma boninense TaxID=34458 RepID=A0A5K1JUF6_9APHY|nr:Uncharacterized protein [Ganoderma boninense]